MAFGDNQLDGYDDGDKPIAFHHKTGEYRERQPQRIKDIASGEYTKKRGFFKVLVAGKGNRSIFIVLCITFAIVIFVSMFGKNSYEATVDGVSYSLRAYPFGDKVYVSLEVTSPQKKTMPVKLVTAKFSMYNTDNAEAAAAQDVCQFDGTKQELKAVFEDYDFVKVKCTVESGEKTTELTAKVSKSQR
jgi:hypothetical protein